jgi:hypothetical protein
MNITQQFKTLQALMIEMHNQEGGHVQMATLGSSLLRSVKENKTSLYFNGKYAIPETIDPIIVEIACEPRRLDVADDLLRESQVPLSVILDTISESSFDVVLGQANYMDHRGASEDYDAAVQEKKHKPFSSFTEKDLDGLRYFMKKLKLDMFDALNFLAAKYDRDLRELANKTEKVEHLLKQNQTIHQLEAEAGILIANSTNLLTSLDDVIAYADNHTEAELEADDANEDKLEAHLRNTINAAHANSLKESQSEKVLSIPGLEPQTHAQTRVEESYAAGELLKYLKMHPEAVLDLGASTSIGGAGAAAFAAAQGAMAHTARAENGFSNSELAVWMLAFSSLLWVSKKAYNNRHYVYNLFFKPVEIENKIEEGLGEQETAKAGFKVKIN